MFQLSAGKQDTGAKSQESSCSEEISQSTDHPQHQAQALQRQSGEAQQMEGIDYPGRSSLVDEDEPPDWYNGQAYTECCHAGSANLWGE